MSDIPAWAIERAKKLATAELRKTHPQGEVLSGSFDGRNECATAFARYIAEHEDGPVDPLLIEAQKFAESWAPFMTTPHPPTRFDRLQDMALAALRRGIELANEEAK